MSGRRTRRLVASTRAIEGDFGCGRSDIPGRVFAAAPKPAYIEEAMSHIAFPRLDQTILARREAIVEGLAAILPPECLIADESGRRAFETDALTAYRRLPLAVVAAALDRGGRARPALCRDAEGQCRAARRRHVAVGRRDPAGGRGRRRRSPR